MKNLMLNDGRKLLKFTYNFRRFALPIKSIYKLIK